MGSKELARRSEGCGRAGASKWFEDATIVSDGWTRGQCRAIELAMAVFVALLILVEAVVRA